MSIKLQLPKIAELTPRIMVIGVGGAGCNAVDNMIATGLEGVEYVVANTDAQALARSSAEHRIQLGINLTEGLGAGANPEIGQAAAEEALDELRAHMAGCHMVFLAAGMGGGTGTGALPVIAKAARDMQILTVGIVTKPFQFEGSRRMRMAEEGLGALQKVVDTLIVIPNQNLFRITNEKTSFAEAFLLADQVLFSGIACIVDLIVKDGLINLDFADVKAVMKGMGAAMMGTGEASGDRRAVKAAEQAITNPLLDDVSLAGAKGLLVSIIGSKQMSLYEVDAAASRVKQDADPEANIIVGASFDDSLGDRIRVSIVASGIAHAASQRIGGASIGANASRPSTATQPQSTLAPSAAASSAKVGGNNSPGLSTSAETASSITHAAPPPASVTVAEPEPGPDDAAGDAIKFEPIPASALRDSSPAAARPAPLPSDPYMGQHRAKDFADVLSEVIGRVDQSEEVVERGRDDVPPIAAWESPDGVRVEEAPPVLPHRSAPPPIPAQGGRDRHGSELSHGFVPERPAPIDRNVRQIPDIADFPEVAQREYNARQAPPPPGSHADNAQGLLNRLGLFRRKAPESPTGGGAEASAHESQRRPLPDTSSPRSDDRGRSDPRSDQLRHAERQASDHQDVSGAGGRRR